MIFLLVFWLFLLGALAVGWQAGDRRDRRVILAIGTAAALSALSHLFVAEPLSLVLVWVVDVTLLAIMVRFALLTRRHWPIWFSGFQATGMVVGAFALLFAGDERVTLLLLSGFWGIPALLSLVVGLLADQRHGIANTKV